MGDIGGKSPKCYQTRRIMLSACHRLHSPHLTDEENKKVYGKCNHVNGHGHNYISVVTRGVLRTAYFALLNSPMPYAVLAWGHAPHWRGTIRVIAGLGYRDCSKQKFVELKVTLFGEIDPKTGMLMNLTDLKEYMEEAIMKPMDHKNIDKDIDYFKDKASTTENVAIYVWNRMKEVMDHPDWLYQVEIYETENNIVQYRGD